MKIRKSTIILVCFFFVGLSVMLYPSFSNFWNSKTQSRAIATYNETVENLDDTETEELFAKAEAYNEALSELPSPLSSYESLDGDYWETLDISGTGIMGYITIEKINVELPIYHGTSQEVLQIAAGHLEGTSLPIGGEGTHCVISAHRGLPSAKLFTNLDELVEGDIFTVTVLDRTITYQVDQIRTVLPSEVSNLNMEDGKDYLTLMTCTPYGINTHRLLVRGVRIENLADSDYVPGDAYEIHSSLVAMLVAVPILLVLLMALLIRQKYLKRLERKAQRLEKLSKSQVMGRPPTDATTEKRKFTQTGESDKI